MGARGGPGDLLKTHENALLAGGCEAAAGVCAAHRLTLHWSYTGNIYGKINMATRHWCGKKKIHGTNFGLKLPFQFACTLNSLSVFCQFLPLK